MVNPEGIWPGIVVDNADPDRMGKVQVRVSLIHGAPDAVEKIADADLPWAWPCFPSPGKGSGMAIVPEIGAGVWVMFHQGDIRLPVWLGGWFGNGDPISEHEDGYAPDPKTYVVKTPGGQLIQLSDKPAQEFLLLQDSIGQLMRFNSSQQAIELIGLGTYTEQIALTKSEQIGTSMTTTVGTDMTTTVGGVASMTAAELNLTSLGIMNIQSTSVLTMTALATMILSVIGLLTLNAGAAITITAVGVVQILSTSLILGIVANAKKLLHEDMLTLYNAHTHNYNPGPGGPTPTTTPNVPAVIDVHTTVNLRGS